MPFLDEFVLGFFYLQGTESTDGQDTGSDEDGNGFAGINEVPERHIANDCSDTSQTTEEAKARGSGK